MKRIDGDKMAAALRQHYSEMGRADWWDAFEAQFTSEVPDGLATRMAALLPCSCAHDDHVAERADLRTLATPAACAALDEAARRLPQALAERDVLRERVGRQSALLTERTEERDAAVAKAAEAAALLAEAIRRAETAEKERDAARAVLMDVEWSGTTGEWSACPSCGAEWHKVSPAHRAGCALVTALGR